MQSIDILNCEMGSVTSRQDHSAVFRVNTPELLPSQAGALMALHGRAVRVAIFPHDGDAEEKMTIKTVKAGRSPSQKLRAALYTLHQQQEISEPFQPWYERQMQTLIESVNKQLE